MSIDWQCPDCGMQSRLASDMVRIMAWYPRLKGWMPHWVCRECATDHVEIAHFIGIPVGGSSLRGSL